MIRPHDNRRVNGGRLIAAPTRDQVTLRRGRCPHRPVSLVRRVSRADGDIGPYGLISWPLVIVGSEIPYRYSSSLSISRSR